MQIARRISDRIKDCARLVDAFFYYVNPGLDGYPVLHPHGWTQCPMESFMGWTRRSLSVEQT